MMVNPTNTYTKAIYSDISFWKDKKKNAIETGKIDTLRDKWLKTEPDKTRNHIEGVRRVFTDNNPQLENEALDCARLLKMELMSTKEALLSLAQTKGQSPILDEAIEKISSAIQESNQLILDISKRKQEREYGVNPAVSQLAAKVKHLQKSQAAPTPIAVIPLGQVIPASSTRPYKTFFEPSPSEVNLARALIVGIKNDTSEYLLRDDAAGSMVTVPAAYGVDADRGIYILNGRILYSPGDPIVKAVNAYREYCQALGGHDLGYTFASLLGQSHTQNLLTKAMELFAPLFSQAPLLPGSEGATFDAIIKEGMISLSVKVIMEGKKPSEGIGKQALLMKTELRFPLEELKSATALIADSSIFGEVLQADAREIEQKKDQIKYLLQHTVLLSATAIDYVSSPCATKELAEEYLPDF